MKFILIAAIATLSTLSAYSCSEDGTTGIAPENNLKISVYSKKANDMTEERFNEIIDSVETVYAPIIASEFNARLEVIRGWNDGTVNAYASRSSDENGDIFKVKMFGGLARHSATTEDAFALVICHEIGHHIGGAPKKTLYGRPRWASNEGQSDYWGTLKCLRRVWLGQDNKAVLSKKSIPSTVLTSCQGSFDKPEDIAICTRSAMAGLSLGNLLRDLKNSSRDEEDQVPEIDFSTPDVNVVSSTNHNHPMPQCRLDTYLSGALCPMDFATNVDQENADVGTCARSKYDEQGIRPLCWFKPVAE